MNPAHPAPHYNASSLVQSIPRHLSLMFLQHLLDISLALRTTIPRSTGVNPGLTLFSLIIPVYISAKYLQFL